MAENPNITELDSDYEPKENSAVEINGALPGEGDGVSYWTKDDDGNLVPADGEPLSVDELLGKYPATIVYAETSAFDGGGEGRQGYDPADYADIGGAVNQAINDVIANVGSKDDDGKIILPWGIHDIGTTIQKDDLSDIIQLEFEGKGGIAETGATGTTLNSTITDGSDIISLGSTAENSNTWLEDIEVRGNSTGAEPNNDGYAIYLNTSDFGGVRKVGQVNTGKGIYLDLKECSADTILSRYARDGPSITCKGAYSEFRQLEAEDAQGGNPAILVQDAVHCKFDRGEGEFSKHGMQISGSVTRVDVAGYRFQENNNWGVDIFNCTRVNLRDCRTVKNGSGGIRVVNGDNVTIEDMELEENNGPHIEIQQGAVGVTVRGDNEFNGSGAKYNVDGGARDVWIEDRAVNGNVVSSPSSSSVSISFDTLFTKKPSVLVDADGAAFTGYSNWTTNTNGYYNGVDLTFGATPSEIRWNITPASKPT